MRHTTPGPKSKRRGFAARLLGDVRAATAIEYGLIIAVIVIAMIASFAAVANVTTNMWNKVNVDVTQAS